MSPLLHYFSTKEGSLTVSTAVRMDGGITVHAGVKVERSIMSHTNPIVGYAVVVVQLSFALLIRPVVVTPS
jgi:hypothetical protein